MAIRRKQVCLFGTSADPPTGQGGHLGIAQHLVSMDFDEVRILPVYSHMFGVSKNIRGLHLLTLSISFKQFIEWHAHPPTQLSHHYTVVLPFLPL